MACATAGRWLLRCRVELRAELRVKQCFVRSRESGVVPVCQRATTGYHRTVGGVTDGLELPQSANQLEVTDVFSVSCKNPANLIVDLL